MEGGWAEGRHTERKREREGGREREEEEEEKEQINSIIQKQIYLSRQNN